MRLRKGTDNFYKLVTQSDFIVDKSLFIKEVIDNEEDAILISRPRRWGKSINLDMLHRFLCIEVDDRGEILDTNSNRVLFEGGRVLVEEDGNYKDIKALQISKLEDAKYMNKQGKSPIILFNFKECKGHDYLTTIDSIRNQISNLFKKYQYLKFSDKLGEEDKELFINYLKGEQDFEKLKDSLSFLSRVLFDHFKKQVWILIDEHDKPGSNFLTLKNFWDLIEDREKVTNFVTSMLSRCGMSNSYVYKMVITGVTDFIHREGDSGFNNLAVYGMRSYRFIDSYGLSLLEVKDLLDKSAINVEHDIILANMREWYDGYVMKDSLGNEVSIYNIWSVIKHLGEVSEFQKPVQPKSHWSKSGIPTILRNINNMGACDKFVEELRKLSEGKEACLDLPPEDFDILTNIDDESVAEQLVVYLLMQSGYLNITSENVMLPNLEVNENVRSEIMPIWAKNKIKEIYGDNYTLEKVFSSLSNVLEDIKSFKGYLNELLIKIDCGDKSEYYFSSLIGGIIEAYGLIHPTIARYKVFIEKNFNKGRIDNIFYPKESSLPVIIHEYKKYDRTQSVSDENSILDGELRQIILKNYLSEPIYKLESHNHYHFKYIKIRGILFIRDENSSKWSVKIKERVLTIHNALKIVRYVENNFSKKSIKSKSKIQEFMKNDIDYFLENIIKL